MNNQLEFDVEVEQQTKSEQYSRWVIKRIHKHDKDAGGIVSIITGAQGSGKTGTLLSFAVYTINNYPNEKVFWSNTFDAPIQTLKLPDQSKVHYLIEKDKGIVFRDRNRRLKDISSTINYDEFTTMDELYDKAKPGKVNVVFFANRMDWMQFIRYLRSAGEWVHIYIDELSEIAPAFQKGKYWKKIEDFSKDLKEARKCMMNVHTTTQATQDIDHRILTKVMLFIYLPGAHTYKYGRVTQHAIDNLDEDHINGNSAYVEYSGKFGKTRFRDIFKPSTTNIEAHCNE